MAQRLSWVRHVMAGSLLLAFAGAATADDVRVNVSAKTKQVRRTSVIIGANVRLHGGETGGRISDIVINDHGCIDYVVVMHDERYILVPWSAGAFDYDQRLITLRIGRDVFMTAPHFTGNNWPDLRDAQFTTKINTVFKVNGTRREGRLEGDNSRNRNDRKNKDNADDALDNAQNRRQTDADREDKAENRKSENRKSDSSREEKVDRAQKSPKQTEKVPAPSTPKAPDKKDG